MKTNQMQHHEVSLSKWVQSILTLDGKPYSLADRGYTLPFFDNGYSELLMCCARQTEKTVSVEQLVSLDNGRLIRAGDVLIGHRLAALDMDQLKASHGEVTWRSRVYRKPCIRIKTRLGLEMDIATTHPVLTFNGWVEGGELVVGTRVAAMSRVGEFTGSYQCDDNELTILAMLIGDGHMLSESSVGFTQSPGPASEAYQQALRNLGIDYRVYNKFGTDSVSYRHAPPPLVVRSGLIGSRSSTKVIPDFVFDLSREQTALFLNRLWSTDGSVKHNRPSIYDLVYASMSKLMVQQVQALLWKFGIPSRIRENWPNIYKRRGEHRVAYLLRIETIEGVHRFLSEIGAIGKSEGILLPDLTVRHINNRHTIPAEVGVIMGQIYDIAPFSDRDMRKCALHKIVTKPITPRKLMRYVDYFRRGLDHPLIDKLGRIAKADVAWDSIVSIEDLGKLDCVDFTVSPHNNFITGGIVTHNSTMLAAMAMGWMTAFPNFNVLYGCPDLKKVRQWSHDKVRPFFSSPKITLVTGGAPIQSNVEVKSLANGSTLYIRNSDPDGDNFRGVSVGAVLADEVQDMVGKAIIVAEEALSHSPWPIKFKRYSGTPKSLDNTIEALWRRSTQTEWLVRCPHCSKSDSCYNNLGIDNISPAGLICSRCKNPIDARTGRWVHSYPQRYLKGFRISQIMVPWTDFAEVYYNKLATYSTALFMNEVLGISYESGAKYLTMDEVQQVCAESGEYDMTLELDKEAKSHRRVAGVDWGVSAEGGATTVVTIAVCIRPDKIKIIYCRRLPPAMPLDEQTEAVQDILAKYKVDYVCADKGAAGDRNLHLAHVVGASNILQVHFTGSGTLTKKFFEDIAQLNLNRVMALSDFRTEFTRRRHFLLPKWEVWEPFAQDMLTQIVETDSGGNLLYNHPAGTLDDVLMSLVYVNVARKMVYGMPLISTIPNSTFLQAKIARD